MQRIRTAQRLIFAIMNAHYDTANAILEAGADPNIVDKAGMAALYAAVDMSSLGEVYGMPPRKVNDTLKPADLISRLIAKGAVVDARLTSATLQRNHTPGEGQLGAGTTPLMRAARNGDYAAMKILLAAGADPTLKQPRGTTALMMASGLGRGLGCSQRITAPRPTCARPWNCSSSATSTSTPQPTMASRRFIWRHRAALIRLSRCWPRQARVST